MAAPATVYLNNGAKLPVKVDGVAQYDSLAALKLTAYGSNIKTLFYLDGVLIIDNGSGSIGFIGYAKIGSGNHAFHVASRRSKLVVENSIGEKFQIFNDGGLNTLADAVLTGTSLRWANYVIAGTFIKSSYYANTTSFKIQSKKVSESTWLDVFEYSSAIAANTNLTQDSELFLAYQKDDVIQLRVLATNEEGVTTSAVSQITLLDKIKNITADFRSTPCDDGTIGSFWIKQGDFDLIFTTITEDPQVSGIYLYKNNSLTTKADAGYYYGINDNKSYLVDSNGQITSYVICTGGGTVGSPFTIHAFQSDGTLNNLQRLGLAQTAANNKADSISYNAYDDAGHFYQDSAGSIDSFWIAISGDVYNTSDYDVVVYRIQGGAITNTYPYTVTL